MVVLPTPPSGLRWVELFSSSFYTSRSYSSGPSLLLRGIPRPHSLSRPLLPRGLWNLLKDRVVDKPCVPNSNKKDVESSPGTPGVPNLRPLCPSPESRRGRDSVETRVSVMSVSNPLAILENQDLVYSSKRSRIRYTKRSNITVRVPTCFCSFGVERFGGRLWFLD